MQGILVMPPYNAASRISAETDTIDGTNRSYTFARDSDDQLLTAVTPEGTYTFTVDERNNRSTKRLQTPSSDTTEYYTYNEGDQLLSMTRKDTVTQTILVSYTYAYDAQGRRTSQTKTSVTPPEVTSYSYQVGGNLEQITLPDSSTIQYQYDAYGNRIQKETSTELITYHYSGASLQQEVHKDPSTLTILYTLTYVPWGFVKTVGQTSTSYYYLYDQRGNTRGITDAQGTILETYHYSPYGILLSTPSISQPHFLSGNAQCQYEAESSLYYMHARYYDAHTGRFLTKDALPGSMSSPLSQNRYTYCQNDPITLIDPTGNSPENTGNPPRMSGPIAHVSYNPGRIPDITQPGGPGIITNPGLHTGGATISPGDMITTSYDACIVKNETENGGYTLTFKMGGDDITMHVDENGEITGFSADTPKGKAIAAGMNDGVWELKDAGIHPNPIAFIQAQQEFYHTNIRMFHSFETAYLNLGFIPTDKEYINPYSGKGREKDGVAKGYDGYYRFAYNAARGYGIALNMGVAGRMLDINGNPYNTSNSGASSEFQLKMMIGFSVSYFDRELGTNMGLFSSFTSDGKQTLGLIQVAQLVFATMATESSINATSWGWNTEDGKVVSVDLGLMGLNFPLKNKQTKEQRIEELRSDGFFDPFKNTFYGVGVLYNKVRGSTGTDWYPGDGPLSQSQWQDVLWNYQGAGMMRWLVWENMLRLNYCVVEYDWEGDKRIKQKIGIGPSLSPWLIPWGKDIVVP